MAVVVNSRTTFIHCKTMELPRSVSLIRFGDRTIAMFSAFMRVAPTLVTTSHAISSTKLNTEL